MKTIRSKKPILFVLAALLLAVAGFAVLRLAPTYCTFGNWVGFDMPDVATAWRGIFDQAHIRATGVSAGGQGETSECTVDTLIGPYSYTVQPSNGNATAVSATIPVDRVTDDAALGDIVLKILAASKTLPENQRMLDPHLYLLFVSGTDSRRVDFDLGSASNWPPAGLTSAQFFEMLAGQSQ